MVLLIQLFLFPLIVTIVYSTNSVPIGPYKQQLLDVHNEYRREEGSSNMNALVWDDALSRQAANWVKRCTFEHEMKGKGENLAYDSHPYSNEVLINNSMKAWYDEKKLYNYNGKQCGPMACHYTQIVWATTRKVGCAIQKCDYLYVFGRPEKNAWYLGCWYDPKGNDMTEYPYLRGPSCSNCLKGQTCENKLCVGEGEEVCEDLRSQCSMWQSIGECNRNKPFMEKQCRKACGICKGGASDKGVEDVTKQDCGDVVATTQCRIWKYDCKRNKRYMEKNCKKTCGYCS